MRLSPKMYSYNLQVFKLVKFLFTMSQLNTAPEVNPTHLETHFNQQMLVKDTVMIHNFVYDSLEDRGIKKMMSVPQADWIKITEKNKYIGQFDWVVGDTAPQPSIDIDFNYIRPLIPVGLEINSFSKLNSILISIKPTNNALYQGLYALGFAPVPHSTFVNNTYGVSVTGTNEAFFQLDTVFISPNNTDEINMIIPINFPFEWFRNRRNPLGQTYSDYLELYSNSYIFGTIFKKIIFPLESTSPGLSFTFTISGQLIGLETAGLRIAG